LQEYETTYVIDSLLKSEEIEGIINKYERFISANGGEIRRSERWGKKRLAYEIKKRQYGYYVYIRYAGPSDIVKPLEREFRLNESILRYLTVKLTSKMLQHEQLKETKRVQEKSAAMIEDIEEPFLVNEPDNNIDLPALESEEKLVDQIPLDEGEQKPEDIAELAKDDPDESLNMVVEIIVRIMAY